MTTTASWVGSAALNPAPQPVPMFTSAVRAGFPSPADDHLDAEMDLHGYVVKRPAATFFARSEGDSMIGDGIHHGDLLVVDRSLEPLPGRVIVVALDGELTVKRLERVGQRTRANA
ncbi:MAG TPA: peptidase S24 [Halomonas campaniensis]|uniref:Peptidase S24 n=1 Tax=Halomonas campaniensis TaxID=213554 RepID=A0A3D0KC74_9GAMM|nr:S24 family peptidase [Halomonas sp. 3F2F]HCA01142.1 peptidase S24 [Halomonas campaniensis]